MKPSMLATYQLLTRFGAPLLWLYLKWRQYQGKESTTRFAERFGHASMARPSGQLWWLHAASIGEVVSLKPLMQAIQAQQPGLSLLLTSGTVSSATMLEGCLPDGVIHQYIPVDTPGACQRFLAHWQPQLGIYTESELWPNMLREASKRQVVLALVNARMSDKSYRRWQLLDHMIGSLLQCFALVAAQTAQDAERYDSLGARHVVQLGHLKEDAAELAYNPDEYTDWRHAITRPMIVAASIHPGEDLLMAELLVEIKKTQPDALLIVAPRHPPKAPTMLSVLQSKGAKAMLRSASAQLPDAQTDIYIADTIGELGLWYRLADVVVMGGSFIPHGGQNPLEAISLGKPVIIGPHTHNFADMVQQLSACGAIDQLPSTDAEPMARHVQALLAQPDSAHAQVTAASAWLKAKPAVASKLAKTLGELV